MNTDNTSNSTNNTAGQSTPKSNTGETLSRVAEEGGIEPAQRSPDPAAEKDEMRRDCRRWRRILGKGR